MTSVKKYLILAFIMFYIFSDMECRTVTLEEKEAAMAVKKQAAIDACEEDINWDMYGQRHFSYAVFENKGIFKQMIAIIFVDLKVSTFPQESLARQFLDYVFNAIKKPKCYGTHEYCSWMTNYQSREYCNFTFFDKNEYYKQCIDDMTAGGFTGDAKFNIHRLFYDWKKGDTVNARIDNFIGTLKLAVEVRDQDSFPLPLCGKGRLTKGYTPNEWCEISGKYKKKLYD